MSKTSYFEYILTKTRKLQHYKRKTWRRYRRNLSKANKKTWYLDNWSKSGCFLILCNLFRFDYLNSHVFSLVKYLPSIKIELGNHFVHLTNGDKCRLKRVHSLVSEAGLLYCVALFQNMFFRAVIPPSSPVQGACHTKYYKKMSSGTGSTWHFYMDRTLHTPRGCWQSSKEE